MNKLTPHISDLLEPAKYRGIDLFQQTRLTDNIEFMVTLFRELAQYPDGMPSKCDSPEMVRLVKKLEGFNGVSCDGIRKNVFPDLEKLRFITRRGKGKNWDSLIIQDTGLLLTDENDDFQRKSLIESAYRRYRHENKEFKEFLERLKVVVEKFGESLWWEIWMCMRVDVDFTYLLNKMVNIRKEFGLRKNIHRGIDEVTKLFLQHNVGGQKRIVAINFGNVINKVVSFGTKATFFFFSVSGTGRKIIIKGQFDTSTTKAQRTYTRDPYYIQIGNDDGLEYHHIIPFENVHYNLNIHEKIDSRENLIPITPEDHDKFPNRNNDFVKLRVENGKIRFYSISDATKFIEINSTGHLNIDMISKNMIPFNKKIVKEIFNT